MISMREAQKIYRNGAGAFTALRNATLEIASGELVALAGKSGSGKTTLLNLMAGIDVATSGSVRVAGLELRAMSERQLSLWRGRTVGIVFQFFQLMPTLTAAENVMLPMDFAGTLAPRRRRARALQLLDRCGVATQAGKLPSALSGGEQQRVAIARALANEPPLVIADEPTGNLDSVSAVAVLDLFRSLSADGTTVVIATHDPDIRAIASRTITIHDGSIETERP